MSKTAVRVLTFSCLTVVLAACGDKPSEPPPPVDEAAAVRESPAEPTEEPTAPEDQPTPVAPATERAREPVSIENPSATHPASPVPARPTEAPPATELPSVPEIEPVTPSAVPTPEQEARPPSEPARPAPAPPSPAAPASSPAVVDPGGVVAVAAPKPGLEAIGTDKCKRCHKVQYTSWVETAHATREPPLDCEGCHGPGSEYQKISVMKDPAQSRAAGLVEPDREFCATCHKSGWSDDMLQRTHDHRS